MFLLISTSIADGADFQAGSRLYFLLIFVGNISVDIFLDADFSMMSASSSSFTLLDFSISFDTDYFKYFDYRVFSRFSR